jgi:rubrerythrin
MEVQCIHSCRGLCNALSTAEHHELSAIKEYQTFLDQCNYPDVQAILKELITQHQRTLSLLQGKRAELTEKFNILDNINESFG